MRNKTIHEDFESQRDLERWVSKYKRKYSLTDVVKGKLNNLFILRKKQLIADLLARYLIAFKFTLMTHSGHSACTDHPFFLLKFSKREKSSMGILDDLEEQSRNSNFGSTANIPIQNDEFYISELCELEKEFGDEFFIDVGIDELEAFNRKRGEKIENVRLMGKILTEMDETDVEFSDPQAEGAANLVRGISTYIDDHADIPVYLRTSTRTVAEEAVFQTYTHKNFPEVDIRNFVFDGQPIEVKSRVCPHSEKKKQQERVDEQKREEAEARKAAEKKAEEEAAKAAAEEKKKKRPAMDQAYLNNLKAMKVKIPAKVAVPEPFLGSATTRTSSSSRFGSSSIRSMSSRFSTSSVGSSIGSAYKPSTGTKYTTASKYSSYSKY